VLAVPLLLLLTIVKLALTDNGYSKK